MTAAEYAEHIRKVVDQAPPLSGDQRSRLVAILCPALAHSKSAESRRRKAAAKTKAA